MSHFTLINRLHQVLMEQMPFEKGAISCVLRLTTARYDGTTRIISVDATLEARVPIRGPISLHALTFASGITAHIMAIDSFNGIGGEGAVWIVVEQGRLLRTGE